MLNEEELKSQSNLFFHYIQNNNLQGIIKLFRNESIKPWEFLLEEDFSGKFFKIKLIFNRIT